jgi:hypothetical protein
VKHLVATEPVARYRQRFNITAHSGQKIAKRQHTQNFDFIPASTLLDPETNVLLYQGNTHICLRDTHYEMMHFFQLLLFSFSTLSLGTLGSVHAVSQNLQGRNLSYAYSPKTRAGVATVTNLQSFTGALGGVAAPPITLSTVTGRPFNVQGDTFPDFQTAGARTCDTQYTGCSNVCLSSSQHACFENEYFTKLLVK